MSEAAMGQPGSGTGSEGPGCDSFESCFDQAVDSLRVLAAAEVGRSDADDVVQEAAIIGYRKFAEFVQGTNFRAWMAAIVRRVASNHRRGHRRRRVHERGHARMSGVATEIKPKLDGTEPNARLERAIAVLSPEQRSCLLLRVVRMHGYAEIAEILEMPEATVRSHVHRARRRLVEALGEDQATGSGGGDV